MEPRCNDCYRTVMVEDATVVFPNNDITKPGKIYCYSCGEKHEISVKEEG